MTGEAVTGQGLARQMRKQELAEQILLNHILAKGMPEDHPGSLGEVSRKAVDLAEAFLHALRGYAP